MKDLNTLKAEIQAAEGLKFPSPVFARCVLSPVYQCQRDHYFRTFLDLSLSHALMLVRQGLLPSGEGRRIVEGLEALRQRDYSDRAYDPRYEDLFFMLEKDLGELVGTELAGRLHIARSRNDLGLAQYRIGIRTHLLALMKNLEDLLELLLAFAQAHKADLMSAYTHTQPAQPTTLGHYILAVYDALTRDGVRLMAACDDANKSPLGAAAITTTGFAIDRFYTAQLMGFDGIVENSYDCIAGADYLSGAAGALASLALTLSRFLKDTLDFCTVEFGAYRLADPYVQTSSIMPQKRNPSSLEHARPITSRALGGAITVLQMLHNTPMTDMVDSEEDLQPTFYHACDDLAMTMDLLRVNYATLSVNTEHLKKRAGAAYITATELADTLVRDFGLSFRESHGLTAKLVRHLHAMGDQTNAEITTEALAGMARELLGRPLSLTSDQLKTALDPFNFIAVRSVTGGPALVEMDRMIALRAGHPRRSTALAAFLESAGGRLKLDVQRLLESKAEEKQGINPM